MSSRDFDFGTAIWDYRFSESMESLLSPVHIASNEGFLGLATSRLVGQFMDRQPRQSALHQLIERYYPRFERT